MISPAAFEWVMNEGDRLNLSPTQRWVLAVLLSKYNRTWHRTWQGRASLETRTGLDKSTISRATQALSKAGVLIVEPWVRENGGGRLNNRYLFPTYDLKSQQLERLKGQPMVAVHKGESDGWYNMAIVPKSHWAVYPEDIIW